VITRTWGVAENRQVGAVGGQAVGSVLAVARSSGGRALDDEPQSGWFASHKFSRRTDPGSKGTEAWKRDLVRPTINSLGVSYFAQTPEGKRRKQLMIDARSQRDRSSIRLSEPEPIRGVRVLAPKHVGRKETSYIRRVSDSPCSMEGSRRCRRGDPSRANRTRVRPSWTPVTRCWSHRSRPRSSKITAPEENSRIVFPPAVGTRSRRPRHRKAKPCKFVRSCRPGR
jgi:hypothetical protein